MAGQNHNKQPRMDPTKETLPNAKGRGAPANYPMIDSVRPGFCRFLIIWLAKAWPSPVAPLWRPDFDHNFQMPQRSRFSVSRFRGPAILLRAVSGLCHELRRGNRHQKSQKSTKNRLFVSLCAVLWLLISVPPTTNRSA